MATIHRNSNNFQQEYFALWFGTEECKESSSDVDAAFQKNKERTIELLKQDPFQFRFIDERLKNNKQVVLAAVRQYGGALEYASKELQNNKSIVFTALKENPSAFQFASSNLKDDREISIYRH